MRGRIERTDEINMNIAGDWWRPTRRPRNTKRVRIKRKERLSWQEWLADWYRSMHALGWRSQNTGIGPDRVKLTQKEIDECSVLYLQNGTTGVYLYPSVEDVPSITNHLLHWLDGGKHPTKEIRIVRGSRPDARRGIARLDDGTATRVISNVDCAKLKPFLVDFDGGLFQLRPGGDWGPPEDTEAQGIYDGYLRESPHRKSFRKYQKAPEEMAPQCGLPQCGAIFVGGGLYPRMTLK